MARKATVDVDKVMQMLRDGGSTQSVADHFGVSRQAIDLHRRKFIQHGQLIEKRAPRRIVTSPEPAEAGIKGGTVISPREATQAGIKGLSGVSLPEFAEAEKTLYSAAAPSKSAKAGIEGSEAVSLDRLIELIIQAFDSLKQVPKMELEAKLEKYKRDYQKTSERIDILEKAVNKRNW